MTSILDDFLGHTAEEAERLAESSDVMRLTRVGRDLWVAEFDVPFLHQQNDGSIGVESGPLGIAIHFGADYLREVSPLNVVQVREPHLFHPNVRWPHLCVGAIRPGMPLAQVLRQSYEILTYQNFATDDGLNPVACRRLCEEPQLLRLLPPPPRLVRQQLEVSA